MLTHVDGARWWKQFLFWSCETTTLFQKRCFRGSQAKQISPYTKSLDYFTKYITITYVLRCTTPIQHYLLFLSRSSTFHLLREIPLAVIFFESPSLKQNLLRFAAACGSESEVQDASVKRQEELQMMSAPPPSMQPIGRLGWDDGDFGEITSPLSFCPQQNGHSYIQPLGFSGAMNVWEFS